MKKPFLALFLLAALASSGVAQTTVTPGGARSDAILLNVKKLDVLIQVVPLALTKEQIGPLLLALEKVHQKQKEVAAREDKDLLTIDAKVAKLVEEGTNDGKYPARDKQMEIAQFFAQEGTLRQAEANGMLQTVYDACTKALNAGQIKVMEKSLKPELLDPSLKVDQMSSEEKVKFFIRKVLLDPVAYDVLVEMNKHKAQDDTAKPATSPSI